MDRDWAEPLDLEAIAAHAGYSRYHFVRAFKAVYGQTPGQYLTRRRVERAEEMLRTADLSVTEICGLVGFSSLGTFSARFKKQTGLSPSEYRAEHVGRGAALIPGCYAMLWAGGFPPPAGRPENRRPEPRGPRSSGSEHDGPRSSGPRSNGSEHGGSDHSNSEEAG
ncbi:helix-turn-helix transcriptional regulator [Streptomyces peucetius]|uniref:Helix-turn-helix transcriptional regulator n=1 Tax=Streptomyces peucetius TaxID=1950 RepID=A0ABY6ILL8_STRPE|nr:helix-turn-helix transcriptional regulator [Streptomyces peucetius]UYQ66784.1 helix-turn-helix transcriptional regulator [Streptomyces peucetius]